MTGKQPVAGGENSMPKQPIYLQIAKELRRQIDSGNLEQGSQLPTEHELREKYGVSRNTVRDAIGRLEEMHLVEAMPGKGTFVTKRMDPFVTDLSPLVGDGGEESRTYPEQVKEQNREGSAGPLAVVSSTCPPEVAPLLGITPQTEVIIRSQERFIDGDLWSVQTSYYPRKWYEDGADRLLTATDIPEGTLRYLGSVLDLKQVRYEDWITARPAREDEPTRFGLPHNAAMFLIYRTGFTSDGTSIRVTVTLYPADRNQFRYHFDLPNEDDIVQNDASNVPPEGSTDQQG
jgi:GntR family transcriptional regulator